MTIEIVVLALVSTVRPTSLAAVRALLSAPSPRRLMTGYVAAGLAFTIAFGVLVIWAFNGIDVSSGTHRTKGIADIAGGIVVLALAAAVLTRRIGRPHSPEAPKTDGRRWAALLESRLTLRTAALAGPATHIPGLFYLIALDVIVADQPKVPGGLAEVLIYNAIWFAIPIVALAVCIIEPEAARATVGAVDGWVRGHARAIVVIASFGVGAALIVRGALTI